MLREKNGSGSQAVQWGYARILDGPEEVGMGDGGSEDGAEVLRGVFYGDGTPFSLTYFAAFATISEVVTEDQLRKMLRRKVAAFKTQTALAVAIGIPASFLSEVLSGRAVTGKIVSFLGYEKVKTKFFVRRK